MKKFVSIFLAACAISSMSITAFAQQASAINVTSDEQIKLSFGEEKFDELLLPGESYTYPLYIEGDDGTLAPLTDDHLEELRLRTEVRDENSSIASFKLEEKDNAYQLAVTTEAGWPTEQDEVEGVIKAVRRSNGKEAGSVSVDLTVGYPTISDESLEGAQNGEYVFVESSAPVITTEQFAKLDEYTDSGKVTFTNGMWSYEVRVSGQESVNMLYNERAIREISSKFEDQDFLYVSFPGGPAFDFTGTLSIDVSEVDDAFEGQFYVYRYLRGVLEKIDADYDADSKTISFDTKNLGRFVLTDKPIADGTVVDESFAPQNNNTQNNNTQNNSTQNNNTQNNNTQNNSGSVSTEGDYQSSGKDNPETGAHNFAALASAAAVSSLAAGVALLKKKR